MKSADLRERDDCTPAGVCASQLAFVLPRDGALGCGETDAGGYASSVLRRASELSIGDHDDLIEASASNRADDAIGARR
jgi:hypothetical protein